MTKVDRIRVLRWRKSNPEKAHEMAVSLGLRMRKWLSDNPQTERRITENGAAWFKSLSKMWRLRDPKGRAYEFVNLNEFVRTHAHLFEPDDLLSHGKNPHPRAALALGKLRPDRYGRIRGSWKGWTWGPTSAVGTNGHDILQR